MTTRSYVIEAMMKAFDEAIPGGVGALDARFNNSVNDHTTYTVFHHAMTKALDIALEHWDGSHDVDDPHDEQDDSPRERTIDMNRGDK
jgi:hypothetical protein